MNQRYKDLLTYGQHRKDCRTALAWDDGDEEHCTCGLREALDRARLDAQAEEVERLRSERDEARDWVIRGVKGEWYPCKPDIFAATYEPVHPEPSPTKERDT